MKYGALETGLLFQITMSLHVDSHYLIGSSHSVCEDYSLHGTFDLETNPDRHTKTGVIGVIADGCSQSENSDVGARLMAWYIYKSFKQFLYSWEGHDRVFLKNKGQVFHNCVLDDIAIDLSGPSRNLCPYGDAFLDSTVWLLAASENAVSVFGWGDGAFAVKRKSGTTIYCVTYESSAPFYLSYYLDDGRKERYKNSFKNYYILSTISIRQDGTKGITHQEFSYNTPFIMNATNTVEDPIQSVSVCSDGFKTYTNETENVLLGSLEWSTTRMIDYPTVEGVFVERSMRFLEKQDSRKGIHHFDDISMASIAFIPEAKDVQPQ